jgi:Na+/proline symporter
MIIGIAAATFDWSAIGLAAPEGAMVLPKSLLHLTPPLIGTIGIGIIAAAVMSSIDSSFLSIGTLFAINVVMPLNNNKLSDRSLKKTLRLSIIGVGVATLLLALQVKSVYALWYLCADLVYVALVPQLFTTVFLKSSRIEGAVAGLAAGLILRCSFGDSLLGIPALFEAKRVSISHSVNAYFIINNCHCIEDF